MLILTSIRLKNGYNNINDFFLLSEALQVGTYSNIPTPNNNNNNVFIFVSQRRRLNCRQLNGMRIQ